MITKNHYKDFLGTVDVVLEEIEKEKENADDLDYSCLLLREGNLHLAKEYFSNEDVWENFTEEKLDLFVSNLGKSVARANETSFNLCDIYGTLHGISEEDWNRFETERLALSTQYKIWSTFYDFCNGEEL